MKFILRPILASAALYLAACSQPAATGNTLPPLDGNWTVSSGDTHFSIVTVKAGTVAEAHTFSDLTGSVSADGAVKVEIPLSTIATNIDIRDERMRDFLFETATFPTATVTAQVNPAAFADLGIGDSLTVPVAATLDLHGQTGEIDTDLVVTRIGADKVQVATSTPIIIHADDYALGAGVEKLRELASLPAITPSVPVSFSIVFTR